MMTPPLDAWREEIDAQLGNCLSNLPEGELVDAMDYALLGGGKRLRPLLCVASCLDVGGEGGLAIAPACALEMIHCYSLIHDDLPCMDDDDERRGRPSLHRAFDEATAVLVGDALQTLAFDTLLSGDGLEAKTRLAMLRELADASGVRGIVGGQMLDIRSPISDSRSRSALQALQEKKTGALFRCAMRIGLLSAGHTPSLLDQFAAHFGLAFQMADDLRDRLGTRETLGKSPGSDEKSRKLTWPGLLGEAAALEAFKERRRACLKGLAKLECEATLLTELTRTALRTEDFKVSS